MSYICWKHINMKNNSIFNRLAMITIPLVFGSYINIKESNNNDIELCENLDNPKEKIKLDDSCLELVKPKNFEFVSSYISKYNKDIDVNYIIKITEVCNFYGFNDNDKKFKWLMGQILLESGAQQYYKLGHPKEGELVISSAGAIGITQILPSTAYYYLIRIIDTEEKFCILNLGVTNFDFVKDNNLSKKEKIRLCKEWLSFADNNIVMWGHIMNSHLSKYNLKKSLISYNAGVGGMNRFLKRGNLIDNHEYIRGIKQRIKYVNKKRDN